MPQSLQTIHGLLDIVPPVAPPQSNIAVFISSLIVVILLISISVYAVRYFRSNRSRAKRRLRKLKSNIEKQDTEREGLQRDSAFQLATILARGLGINSIISSTPLPADIQQYRERWQTFSNRLSLSRYSHQSGTAADVKDMFDDAFFWLKTWP